MNEPKNILLVRTDRIGDVVLSLPLAKIIKNKYPSSKITFLIREYTKDLLEGHPYIDNVMILKESGGKTLIYENIKQIRAGYFDTSVIVNPTFLIAFILFLSGIKNRIGTGYRWYSLLFNKKFFEHRKYGEKHELVYNLNLLKLIGIDNNDNSENISFNIPITAKSKEKVDKLLTENGINRDLPIVIVHPGSAGSAVDLPISKLKAIVKLIESELSVEILLTGSSSEKELCEKLKLDEKIKNFAGRLSLNELSALINLSNMLIANSTGPIHIAAALNKQVIGFYPKIAACSAARWGPYTEKKKIFVPSLDCSNCNRKQCEELNCMNTIDEWEVFESIKSIIQKEIKSNS